MERQFVLGHSLTINFRRFCSPKRLFMLNTGIDWGRALGIHQTVHACGLRSNATICLQGRLRGGKPVKVHVLTSSPNNKSEVTIDIEETASKAQVKQKLVSATGIPFEHQKVVLSGIGQLAVADKRSNIGFSSCGSTNGMGLAVSGSK